MSLRPRMAAPGVAITGATGFLGRHVLQALDNAGHRPIAVVRNGEAARRALPPGTEIRVADITDAAALTGAFQGVRAAVHLAGLVSLHRRDREALSRTNILGTENFLAAVARAGVRRALFTSTTSAVAALSENRPGAACDERTSFNLAAEPVPYIRAKKAAHDLALAARARGAPVVVLSPSLVLGPEDVNFNTSALLDAVRLRRLPVCPPGGINPVDVRDVARAYVAALAHSDPAPHYILASRENMTLRAFIDRVAALAGVRPPRLVLPRTLALALAGLAEVLNPRGPLTAAGARLGGHYWYFDAALARQDLGLDCRPLEETVTATLAWLAAREKAAREGPVAEQT